MCGDRKVELICINVGCAVHALKKGLCLPGKASSYIADQV